MTTQERGNPLLRGLDRYAGIPLALVSGFVRKVFKRRELVRAPRRIGLLCLGGIGDLLLLSALTDGIRKLHPDASLEIVSSTSNAAALPLNPHADLCHQAPIGRPLQLLAWLRRRQYDILIDASQWARIGAILTNLSGAGYTAGFATSGQCREYGYDSVCLHGSDRHEVENFLDLGRCIWPELTGRPSVKLEEPSKLDGGVYCHMWPAPGPGRKFKTWPESHWCELICAIAQRGYPVYLTGSQADRAACESFKTQHFANMSTVRVIAGECNLVQLASRFAGAQAIIAVNTGIMHLASLTGAPTVGLHGATNPRRWGPVGQNSISLIPDQGECAYLDLGFEYRWQAAPAMAHLPVDKALSALETLTGRPFRQARQ